MAKDINNKEQEAAEIVSKGEKFFEKNSNLIFYIVLGIIIIAFGIWAYIQYVHKPKQTKAYESLYASEAQFIEGNDSTLLNTNTITNEGILATIKEYKGTKAAKLGYLYAGIAYYDMGKYQEAIDHLEKFKSSENMVAPSVVRLIGDCYVQLDQLDKAVSYFEKAADMADNEVISPSCLIKAAHVYEHQKKYDEAIKAYEKIKNKYYTAPEAENADAEVVRISSLKR